LINGQNIPITSHAFLKPGLTVIGTQGAAATVVAGNAASRVFAHTDLVGTDPILVEGFTATGLKSVLATGVAPIEVTSCQMVDNANSAAEAFQSVVTLRGCLIEGNCSNRTDLPAVLSRESRIEFYNCDIRNNVGKHAMEVVEAPLVVMDGCTVSGHTNFGACEFEDVLDLQVRNSVFSGNRDVGVGAGVDAVDCVGIVEFCVFARDSAQGGGGFAMTRGSVGVENCTFYACEAEIGSAMEISGDDPVVRNNIIAYSKGVYGAVDRTQGVNDPSTGCNLFWANEVRNYNTTYGTWTPSASDLYVDPQFCDPSIDDFTLHSSSPAAPGGSPACGAIGALGVGCGTVSIESMSWGRIKAGFRSR
jgi:hypothetical protein